MRSNGMSLAAVTLAALAALLQSTAQGRPQDGEEEVERGPRTLSVSGRGEISAAPDVADISVGVVTEYQTAQESLSANNAAMGVLQDTLKQRGVAARDIQTTNISISPKYSQPRPPRPGVRQQQAEREIVGYQVTNTVRVTIREIDNLGPLLDAVVSAGANQMYGISFRIEDSEKLLDECRKRAMADARRRAELLAGEAGLVLGDPLSISEGGGGQPPQPMYAARSMMAESAVPVAPGEQDLSVSVQVTYELKRPQ